MSESSFQITIGVDIAKSKFDVACLIATKYKHKSFLNTKDGHQSFYDWFTSLCQEIKPLICMESTGSYSFPLAEFLVENHCAVSLVNPAKIHAFAKSELSRAKTDKADAKLIARYAFIMQPTLWTPPPVNICTLQALTHRVEHLLEMIQMERNRLQTANTNIQGSIETVLATLEAELKSTRKAIKDHIDNDPDLKKRADLLDSIPGIGDACTAQLLIVLSEYRQFANARQAVAFAGLAPRLLQSGQWQGKTHIAKNGDCALRKTLFMPALCAWKHNPVICTFCERLKANGKSGKAIVCAAMRKLIHLAFAILKSEQPFDPNYAI